MVYYVCPNCGHRSAEYQASMVHYNSCDVVRVRTVNSPPNSAFAAGATTMPGGGGASAGDAQAGRAASAAAQNDVPEGEQSK